MRKRPAPDNADQAKKKGRPETGTTFYNEILAYKMSIQKTNEIRAYKMRDFQQNRQTNITKRNKTK